VELSQSDASFSSIARKLTEQGFRSRAGTPFSHNQISRMLARVRRRPPRRSYRRPRRCCWVSPGNRQPSPSRRLRSSSSRSSRGT
jgi:hypothetical protein